MARASDSFPARSGVAQAHLRGGLFAGLLVVAYLAGACGQQGGRMRLRGYCRSGVLLQITYNALLSHGFGMG